MGTRGRRNNRSYDICRETERETAEGRVWLEMNLKCKLRNRAQMIGQRGRSLICMHVSWYQGGKSESVSVIIASLSVKPIFEILLARLYFKIYFYFTSFVLIKHLQFGDAVLLHSSCFSSLKNLNDLLTSRSLLLITSVLSITVDPGSTWMPNSSKDQHPGPSEWAAHLHIS